MGRRPVSQATAQADGVVVTPPGFDENVGSSVGVEDLSVQELIPQPFRLYPFHGCATPDLQLARLFR